MTRPAYIQVAARGSRASLRRGLTLIELVISITVAGMMMVALFFIYSHAQSAVDGMSRTLDQSQVPQRILQLIAQDVDRFSADTDELLMQPEVRRENGLVSSRLFMQTQIYDSMMRAVPYEKVVWETRYDAESQSMILYRSHSGLVSEDNLLESQRTPEEASAYVPLCSGLTYFSVTKTPATGLGTPDQLIVSLSFAQPETEGGESVIPPEQIITRTIAVNRLRKIGYIFTEPNLAGLGTGNEPNTPANDADQGGTGKTAADPNKRGRVRE
jgi:prepilin-type N-terminal cleavage/methylation domain-containing protein